MSQNRSHAVMAQRAEPHDSLDFFPTPLWATRALFEHVIGNCWRDHILEDPACGDGAMVRALREYGRDVQAADVHNYGWGHTLHDFLQPYRPTEFVRPSWIITNPPFRLALQFIQQGLELASQGVAVLVRSAFKEGKDRYRQLFRDRPPALIAQFVERVCMFKGVLRDPSKLYWDETSKKWRRASSATSYCWMVWNRWPERRPQSPTIWIPPCRLKLERPGDYPVAA